MSLLLQKKRCQSKCKYYAILLYMLMQIICNKTARIKVTLILRVENIYIWSIYRTVR